MSFLDSLDKFLAVKRKPKEHKLKWKLLEERIVFPVDDADEFVGLVKSRLRARFLAGGEYFESVHAKQVEDGIFAYLLVRTDKKTEEETVVAETYMLQEEERLGMDVTSGYKLQQDLKQMGYEEAFQRDYKVWWFKLGVEMGITVYSITQFGDLIEFSLPATNFPKQREASEKKLFSAIGKLGLAKGDGVPTDAITFQMMSVARGGGAKRKQKFAGKFEL